MGRVDDALRRASEPARESGEVAPLARSTGGDVSALAAEPFADEAGRPAAPIPMPEPMLRTEVDPADPPLRPAQDQAAPDGAGLFDWVDVGFTQKVVVDSHMKPAS